MSATPITVDPNDDEYEDAPIEGVYPFDDGWEITQNGGWIIWVTKVDGMEVEPKVGGTIRLYGRGIGYEVRGICIDGVPVRYMTDEQMREKNHRWVLDNKRKKQEEFEQTGRAKQDAQYDALPRIFQQRIDRFRRNNPDFRWEYEPYELFCCTQAVLIATTLGDVEAIDAWANLPWEKQKEELPGMSDGHSGNTFGVAVGLAKLYASEEPQRVFEAMGALVPLVGSEEYGDKVSPPNGGNR